MASVAKILYFVANPNGYFGSLRIARRASTTVRKHDSRGRSASTAASPAQWLRGPWCVVVAERLCRELRRELCRRSSRQNSRQSVCDELRGTGTERFDFAHRVAPCARSNRAHRCRRWPPTEQDQSDSPTVWRLNHLTVQLSHRTTDLRACSSAQRWRQAQALPCASRRIPTVS